MSGVEIAGLVLGAFPVAVQLIQGYQEGCKPLVDWRRFQATYLRLKQGLNRQWTRFDNNVRILLLPLVNSDEELEELLKKPGGPAWKDQDLEDALRRRLSHNSYTSYLETIEALRDKFDEFKSKLGVSDDARDEILEHFDRKDAKLQKQPLSSKRIDWNYEWNRIRISWSSKELIAILAEIGELNQTLKDLLSDSEKIEVLQQTHRSRRPSTIQQWRTHATALYNFLLKQWPCLCPTSHQARIFLRQIGPGSRKVTPQKSTLDEDQTKFEMSMLVGTPGDDDYLWQGPFACYLHEPSVLKFANRDGVKSDHSGQKPKRKIKFGKAVKIQDSGQTTTMSTPAQSLQTLSPSQSATSTSISTLEQSLQTLSLSQPAPSTSNNDSNSEALCPSLHTTGHISGNLGPFKEGSYDLVITRLGPTAQRNGLQPSLTSLGKILSQETSSSKTMETQRIKLPITQRIRLAVECASLFFFSFNTPWDVQRWSKDAVIVALEEPKLRNSDLRALLEREFPDKGKSYNRLRMEPQEALIQLCVCLQELCFGKAFEKLDAYTRHCENGRPQAHTYRTAAWDLIASVDDELGEYYAEAVRNCLVNALRVGTSQHVESGLWQQAYDEVVEPLQKVLAGVAF